MKAARFELVLICLFGVASALEGDIAVTTTYGGLSQQEIIFYGSIALAQFAAIVILLFVYRMKFLHVITLE